MSRKKLIAFAAAVLVSRQISFAESPQWKLTTADTRAMIEVRDNAPVVARLENVAEGRNWAGSGLRIPLMTKVAGGGQEHPTKWQFVRAQENRTRGTLTLLFKNDDPKLALKSIWRARPGRGPIEHWVEIENQTAQPLTVFQQESLVLSDLVPGGPARLCWVKRGGSNATSEGGTFTDPVVAGHDLVLHSNCEDGSSPIPWLAVQVGDKRGLYVGWEFSGLGRIQATATNDAKSLDIRVGNESNFKTDIGPHETFWVPPAFVGCYTGDVDEGSYRLHRFVLEKLRPKMPANFPDPTLAYNLYLDAGGNRATEADVLRCAHTCHDLGFETFMPDAMWFPETGDWRWDPGRFPHGIGPIEQYVHSSGMKMALWCAWTNGGISPRADALSVRGPHGHPDWFRSNVPPNWSPGPFYGVQLCLGCDDAKQWATEKTQWLVKHHHLDYLKHDMGMIVTSCEQNNHRHKYGVDVSYWAALGYYAVQERLRQACPNVVLENCSGGGHIKDFGVIQRTHYTVATDTLSNLPDRQSIYDSTFAFPPLLLQAYTYDNFYPAKGDEPGPFLWRSGMMSAWQIDPTDTATWTDTERDSAKRATVVYKQWIRPMLQDVKVHHILPRPDGTHWDGMFYMSPTTGRGMLYIFRPDSPHAQQTIHLKGLDAGQQYWVWSEEGLLRPSRKSGDVLMNDGLPIQLARRYSSDLIYLEEASQKMPPGLEAPSDFRLASSKTDSDPFDVSARLSWSRSEHANRYHLIVSAAPDCHDALAEATVSGCTTALANLPADRKLFWKVEAISWGGRRANSGGVGQFTTPSLRKLPGITFASEMPWVKSTAGAGNTVHRNTNYSGKPISIARHKYERGIWTHAFPDATPADVVIDISGQSQETFAAECGIEDSSNGGSAQFQVLVDGQLKAESPVMRPGGVHSFDVPVGGARQVTLRVLNGGDGYSCDHCAWGYARFIHTGASDPIPELMK